MDQTVDTVQTMAEGAVKETTGYINTVFTTVSNIATTYAFKVLLALLIIFVGIKLTKLIVKLINKGRAYQKLDGTVKSFLNSFIKILLYVVVFISASTELGVPATSFITILASCGLAIGLALQGSLTNFAGGLMILIFKPFKVGDYIISGSYEGTVKDINIFYTVLNTVENQVVTIPNGSVSNAPVVDVTGNKTRRISIPIGVSYNSDIDTVHRVLTSLANSCELILQEPAPESRLIKYNDSSIDFELRAWAKNEDYWNAYFFLNDNIKKVFDKNGIEIPFPQADIHIING